MHYLSLDEAAKTRDTCVYALSGECGVTNLLQEPQLLSRVYGNAGLVE